jgi:23S rRNA (uridine2552-2'-O)-methyltransferase
MPKRTGGGKGGSKSGSKSGHASGPGGGNRQLHVRLKTARRHTASSQRWLQRQLNDPYVAAAKREGFRSRAAYKLAEIDDKHHILKAGRRVVDLGAAPGGWSQIAAERTQAASGKGQVVAIDMTAVDPLPGVDFVHLDFTAEGAENRLKALLRDGCADVVLSDMAAPTTGHTGTDHIRIMALAEAAAHFACDVLAPGGAFVSKVLQGGTERELLARLKRAFASVRHIKPPASRAESAELYVVATGFRG